MPTSYTAPIEEGNLNARDFVSHCTRAFGAFVHQREDGIDVPPKPVEVDVNSYSVKALIEAQTRLSKLESLTDDEIEADWRKYFDAVTQSNVDSLLRHKEMLAKYQTVKDKVESWQPNEQAKPIKDYALNQIEISWPYGPWIAEPYETPEEWYDHELARVIRDVERYEAQMQEEHDRLVERREHAIKMLESIADVPE